MRKIALMLLVIAVIAGCGPSAKVTPTPTVSSKVRWTIGTDSFSADESDVTRQGSIIGAIDLKSKPTCMLNLNGGPNAFPTVTDSFLVVNQGQTAVYPKSIGIGLMWGSTEYVALYKGIKSQRALMAVDSNGKLTITIPPTWVYKSTEDSSLFTATISE